MQQLNSHAKANLVVNVVFCGLMALFYSCGSGGSDDAAGTGSVSFSLALQGQGAQQVSNIRAAADAESQFECHTGDYDISEIEVQVVDENQELLAEGGPFNCDEHQGTINDVEAGSGRIAKVFAKDESGNTLLRGNSEPFGVLAGQTADAGMITIAQLGASILTKDDSAATDEDMELTITVDQNDTASYFNESYDSLATVVPKSLTINLKPEHGTALANGDGTVSYKPDTDYFGNDEFTYVVQDNLGVTSNSSSVTIMIKPIDDPPTGLDDKETVFEDSSATQFDVLINDPDVDAGPKSIIAVSDPAGGTVVNNGTNLTYKPDPDFCTPDPGTKTDDFTYTLSPGGSNATVHVTVTCIDDFPVATDDDRIVIEDSGATTFDVLTNDKDIDGGPKTIVVVSDPAGGSVVNNGSSLSYTPDLNFCTPDPETNTDDFTYTLSPGGSEATVKVTVTCIDDFPVAVADDRTVIEDSAATTFDVLTNDTDIDNGPIAIVAVSDPAGGSVVNNGSSLSYTPDPNFCTPDPSINTDDFTYTLSPGGSNAMVSVTVTCESDPPTANDDSGSGFETDEDTSFTTANVLINDSDPDPSDILSIYDVNPTSAKGAIITNLGNGTFTYDPTTSSELNALAGNDHIEDSFNYIVTDGKFTSEAKVTVIVAGVNDNPIANDDLETYETFKSNQLRVPVSGVLDNDTDPDNDSLSAVLLSNVSNGILDLRADGSFTYTPNSLFVGEDTFTYIATDGSLNSNEATVTITVLESGEELWISDGTQAGTVLVKDIYPGPVGSQPRDLTAVNDTIFFAADDGSNGNELWISDGTESGTFMIRDINPDGGSYPFGMANVNAKVFFTAYDGSNGYELWMSDGTVSGTVMVRDINPEGNSNPSGLTDVNGRLFFEANDGIYGDELWMSDGTASGTVLVKDINSEGGSYPYELANVNGKLFFTADDGSNGYELWMSDGTASGTVLVKDIDPEGGSYPYGLTNVNGKLFFTADDGINGYELWVSDGTALGTVMVKDINPEGDSNAYELTNVNGKLFFTADDGINGYELWVSDGTALGTVMVRDINSGGDSNPHGLTNVNGRLLFAADDGKFGYELWISDGTEPGTTLVRDLLPGSGSSNPEWLTAVASRLFFTAATGAGGFELWMSDGTQPGTGQVKIIRPTPSADSLTEFTNVNGMLFFTELEVEK